MKTLLVIELILFGFASALFSEPAVLPNDIAPSPYMRVRYSDESLAELQICLRKLAAVEGDQPVIWLIGVSHIGDRAYYEQLQQVLDSCDLVFYEGVGDSPRLMQQAGVEAPPSLQGDLADALGLVFQLKAIDYKRPHFRNSDVSMAALQQLMAQAEAESSDGKQASKELNQLISLMQGDSAWSGLVDGLMQQLKRAPEIKNATKLMFIEMLGNIKGDLGADQMPPEMQKLMELLIDHRNMIVLEDIQRALRKAKPPKTIGVFYGAAHMHDLEERVSVLGYRVEENRWLGAIRLNLQEAGIRKEDVLMIRRFVKMQMDALK